MKAKRADQMEIYLCDNCAAVHIALYRGGKMIAEAIPDNPEEVQRELALALLESRLRTSGAKGKVH